MDYYGLMYPFQSLLATSLRIAVLGFAVSGAHAQTPASQPATPSVPGAASAANPASGEVPERSILDAALFYQLLLGELNAQGDEPGTAYSLILDVARKTNDARLYERAVNVALQARSGEPALQAARAWKLALPASREANRYVLQILIGLNRVGETLEPLKLEIASTPALERATTIAAVPRYYARASDKKLAASTVEQALAESLNSPALGAAAWTTIGRMRIDASDPTGVLDAASRGQALDPKAEGPALLAMAVMGPKFPQAETVVRKYLAGQPTVEVRMGYARALLDAQRYAESTAQLKLVTTEKPDYAQAWLILGTLELQDKKLLAAEASLKRYAALALPSGGTPSEETSRGLTQAYLSLAQIAEQRKDLPLAESWLSKIDNADDMVSAQSRRAAILASQGKLEDGRKLLRALPAKSLADERLKLMAEVQLLRDNKQFKPAYDLLAEKTQTGEPDFDLIYDQAMLAEKLGRMDEAERLLRRVIAGKPDYHHAYNALGYSLAERNIRLPEARALILKALESAPDDPFITDSLGWVEFRSGNLAEALRILQGAYKAKPDAEIAAHLGEVLWASGQRDQAMVIWREGAALNADNETLLETLKRLRVKL
jgi:tetratricopeptide (TPR) repeat protein